MTVTTTGLPEQYLANGITTIFDFHSRVLLTTDMVVFVNNVQQFTGFTVTLLGGGDSGARVTFSIPPASGLVVELSNEPPPTQLIDYTENTPFPANVQEFGLDKLTLLFQGIRNIVTRTLRRTLRVPIYESGINELPSASTRAGKFIVFDANGQPTVASVVVGTSGINLVASSIAALKSISVTGLANGTLCEVASYYGIGGSSSQLGGGMFRYNSASVAAEDKGTIFQPNAGSGRWERLYAGDIYNTWFGTVGDGVTDDTVAWQAAFDFCVVAGNRRLIGVKGTYLVGPLFINGSAWVAGGKPVVAQNAAVQCFMGEGHMPFGTIFRAKPGAYPNVTDAIITGWNIAGVHFQGLTLDGNNVAATLIDMRWFIAHTSNGNTFRDWWGKNAVIGNKAIILDGAADGVNSNIRYTGGTTEVAISMRLEGGVIMGDNIYINRGRLEVAAQNMTLINGTAFGGVRIVSASFHNYAFHGYQFSEDDTTGIVINADVTAGAFVQSMIFTDVVFLGGAAFSKYFAGRWLNGVLLDGCNFQKPNAFFDTGNWTVNGAANAPTFNFRQCTFAGAGATEPTSISGVVRVSKHSCSVGGVVNPRWTNQFGNFGSDGLFGRNQGPAVLPTDAFFGMGYNRSGASAETELYVRDDIWRLTKWDGAVATINLTMNTTAGEGFYPSPTNTWKLGRLGNLWAEVFATNATINTSDAGMKSSLTTLSAKELAVGSAMLDNIITFQWNDAITAKGGKDKARLHVGLIAQDVKAVFAKNGMSAERYGIYCYDEWEADAEREAGKQHALRTTEAMLLMLASLNERVKKLEG